MLSSFRRSIFLSLFLIHIDNLVQEVVNLLLHLCHLVLLHRYRSLELLVVLLYSLYGLVAQHVHCRQRLSRVPTDILRSIYMFVLGLKCVNGVIQLKDL